MRSKIFTAFFFFFLKSITGFGLSQEVVDILFRHFAFWLYYTIFDLLDEIGKSHQLSFIHQLLSVRWDYILCHDVVGQISEIRGFLEVAIVLNAEFGVPCEALGLINFSINIFLVLFDFTRCRVQHAINLRYE